MHLVALLLSLGAAPMLEEASPPGPAVSTVSAGVSVSAVPQLGLARAEGRLGLGRAGLELGGWSVFLDDTGAIRRGGWLGGRFLALDADAVDIAASVRAYMAQPDPNVAAIAGLGGVAESEIDVFPWLSLRPTFDFIWLGPLVTARLANELLLRSGDWRIGLCGGAQLWARDSAVIAAFGASLSLGWRLELPATAVELVAGLALARDPSFLLRQPVLSAPREELGLWVAFGVAVADARLPGVSPF
jgi:hypothetical protein